MQENIGKQIQKVADIEFEIRANLSHVSNQLNEISAAAAGLDKFKDSAIFAKHHKYAEELKKLTRNVEDCNQKFKELQETTSGSENYLNKFETLIGEYQYINLDIKNLLEELDQFGKEVSAQAEKRFQAKKSDYDKAKVELEKEVNAIREVNEPVKRYIQQIESTISDLEKDGVVESSILTTSKNILQNPQQTIQQVLNEVDNADRKIQALTSKQPTSERITAETSSIRGVTDKLKLANKQLTEKDYDQLDITNRLVSILKYSSDLSKTLTAMDTKIFSNLRNLDTETATDEIAKNLGRQTISEKVKLEKEKKNLQALKEDIGKLDVHMSSHDLQDPSVIQNVRNSLNDLNLKITQIGESITPIKKNVESISNQVHERNFAPVNTLKQRLDEIRLKINESNQLGFRNHEKEINEKIKDFNDQCLAVETNFDNLTRSDQKAEIKKLGTFVFQLERYLSSRYYGMAVEYQSFEEKNKSFEEDIAKSSDNLTDIKAVRDECDVEIKEADSLIAKNTAEGMSKDASKENLKNRILRTNKELSFEKKYNTTIFLTKSDPKRLNAQVPKLRDNAKKIVAELDDFIGAINRELEKGALVRGYSSVAQQAFKSLAGKEGDQIAAEMGKEWGIDEENERREKIQNVLNEVKEIRDELIALKIDESYTGQLSREADARIEKLVDKLNEKTRKLNKLINAVQDKIGQFKTEIGKFLGQTSDAKEASGFNIFMHDLCVRTSKFLRRVQLQNDYRDWRVLHDEEPDRQAKRKLLQDKRKELSDKGQALTSDLRQARREHEQLLNLQAARQNPLKDIEWPLTYQNDDGNTLVHIAVAENNVEMLLVFLQQSEHESFDSEALSIKNKQGNTPIDLAVEKNNVSIINLLLKEDSHLDYNRWRSIVNSKDPQLVGQFAQKHDIKTYTRHINFMTDRKFWMSVLKNSPDAKAGFLLGAQDNYGNTLVHAAIQSQDIEDTKWLLSNSANITIKNKQGELSTDLMKSENEKYRKQKTSERNQSYLGMSISGVLLAGALLVGGLAVSGPVGWIVAGIVGLIGLGGIVKNFVDAYDASAFKPPFPAIPTEVIPTREELKVSEKLLAYLKGYKGPKGKGIDITGEELLDEKKGIWKIEVSPITKQTIARMEEHKDIVEKRTAIDVKLFEALQLVFEKHKQNKNKLVRFRDFLVRIKEVAPDMLEGFNNENADSVLSNQLNQINRVDQVMVQAEQAKFKAQQHFERYEFALFKKEFSRFKNIVDENNLMHAVESIEEMQEKIKPIEAELSKLKQKVGDDVMPDVNNFEKLKKTFRGYKIKQDSIQKLLSEMQDKDTVLMADFEKLAVQIKRAENLIKLAEKNLQEAGRYLEGYALSLFGIEIEQFRARSNRLRSLMQQLDDMQKGIEAKIAQPVENEPMKVDSVAEPSKEEVSLQAVPVVEPSKEETVPLSMEPQNERPYEEKPTQPESSQKESAHSSYAHVFTQLMSEKFGGMKKAYEEEKKEVDQKIQKEAKPDVPKIEQESGVTREHLSVFQAMRQKARMADHQATQQEKMGKSADRDVKPPTRGQ